MTKLAPILDNFRSYLKKPSFNVKTAVGTFSATLGKIGPLLILASGQTVGYGKKFF